MYTYLSPIYIQYMYIDSVLVEIEPAVSTAFVGARTGRNDSRLGCKEHPEASCRPRCGCRLLRGFGLQYNLT